MRPVALLVVLSATILCAPAAAAQEYYDPVQKLERELKSLKLAFGELLPMIKEKAKELKAKGKQKFYEDNKDECTVTERHPDGSVKNYDYEPALRAKRLRDKVAAKRKELVAELDRSIKLLEEQIADLERRKGFYEESLEKLAALRDDLEAQRKEWANLIYRAIVDGIKDLIPAFDSLLDDKLDDIDKEMEKLPEGAPKVWKGIPVKKLAQLKGALGAMRQGWNGGKELYAALTAKDKLSAVRALTRGMKEVQGAVKDILTIVNPENRKTFGTIGNAIGGFLSFTEAVEIWSVKGFSDPEASREAGKAVRSGLKALGGIFPPVKAGEKIARGIEMGAECLVAGYAAYHVGWAAGLNLENFEKAREAVASLDAQIAALKKKLESYRTMRKNEGGGK
ncbi:MAG: hypothetical protein ACYTAF_08380 [Planctomycetota bacterium]|jgi:chromosome segregation ATPase